MSGYYDNVFYVHLAITVQVADQACGRDKSCLIGEYIVIVVRFAQVSSRQRIC